MPMAAAPERRSPERAHVRESLLPTLEPLRRLLGALPAESWFPEQLFDCASDTLFFVKNREACYVAVNQSLADRCGAPSKAALLGCTALDLFPPPFGAAYYEQDRRVLDTGEEIRDLLQLVPRGDGRWGWCLSYKFPLADGEGRIIGLCGICKEVERADPPQEATPQLARVIEHLQQRYAEPLRIEALARVAGLSARHLERLCKRLLGLTPQQLLAKTRVEAAMRRLIEGCESMAEIAVACGYSDQSAFTRQFKAVVGLTPTRFRSVRRSEAAEPHPAPAS